MATTQDLILIVDGEGESLAVLREAAGRVHMAHAEIESYSAWPATLAIHAPKIVVMCVERPNADPLKILKTLASHNTYPSILLVGNAGTRVLTTVKRAAEERGFPVIGVAHRPLEVTQVESLLIGHNCAVPQLGRDEIYNAIINHEFTLVYQPVLTVAGELMTMTGTEALVRWRHPQRGQLLPGDFLPAVEANGLMAQLTDFVLTEAIRQAGHWQSCGLKLEMIINLSTSLVKDVAFPERLASVLSEHEVHPTRICLDIQDTEITRNSELMFDVFTRLRNLGIGLAIDNFGTGSSSLIDLYRLPFSEIKIDGALLKNAITEREAEVIVKSLAKLAHDLNIRVAAKGLESLETLWLASEAGFDTVQGRLLCAPVSAGVIEQLASQGPIPAPRAIPQDAAIHDDSINQSAILRRPRDTKRHSVVTS